MTGVNDSRQGLGGSRSYEWARTVAMRTKRKGAPIGPEEDGPKDAPSTKDESELESVPEGGEKVVDRCAHERDRDNCGHGDERQD